MFSQFPVFTLDAPYIKISKHGLSLFATTPVFIYLLAPLRRDWIVKFLWITILSTALVGLFYQNTGWVQFGYRFSLDYTPYLFMLLAVGRRKIGPLFIVLMILSIIVSTFGAVTFGWKNFMDKFYFDGFINP